MKNADVAKLEDHLGYWLRCLSNFVSDSFSQKLGQYDISVAQWVVLRVLYDKDSLTLNETAALVGVDKSTLSRMIDRLVLRELVKRSEGEDRRSLGLSLTPVARKLIPKLAALADENDQAFFKTLSAKQKKDFLATLQQLLKANGWDITKQGRDRMK